MTTSRYPDEMPISFHNDSNELRNCLMSLHTFPFVSITWEKDRELSADSGESRGEWNIEISCHGRSFLSKHGQFTNALWSAYTQAENYDAEEYAKRDRLRRDALAKLTKEERKELGL